MGFGNAKIQDDSKNSNVILKIFCFAFAREEANVCLERKSVQVKKFMGLAYERTESYFTKNTASEAFAA